MAGNIVEQFRKRLSPSRVSPVARSQTRQRNNLFGGVQASNERLRSTVMEPYRILPSQVREVDGERFVVPRLQPRQTVDLRKALQRRVGAGRASSGMTTGGFFGSSLMMGRGRGGVAPVTRPEAPDIVDDSDQREDGKLSDKVLEDAAFRHVEDANRRRVLSQLREDPKFQKHLEYVKKRRGVGTRVAALQKKRELEAERRKEAAMRFWEAKAASGNKFAQDAIKWKRGEAGRQAERELSEKQGKLLDAQTAVKESEAKKLQEPGYYTKAEETRIAFLSKAMEANPAKADDYLREIEKINRAAETRNGGAGEGGTVSVASEPPPVVPDIPDNATNQDIWDWVNKLSPGGIVPENIKELAAQEGITEAQLEQVLESQQPGVLKSLYEKYQTHPWTGSLAGRGARFATGLLTMNPWLLSESMVNDPKYGRDIAKTQRLRETLKRRLSPGAR